VSPIVRSNYKLLNRSSQIRESVSFGRLGLVPRVNFHADTNGSEEHATTDTLISTPKTATHAAQNYTITDRISDYVHSQK